MTSQSVKGLIKQYRSFIVELELADCSVLFLTILTEAHHFVLAFTIYHPQHDSDQPPIVILMSLLVYLNYSFAGFRLRWKKVLYESASGIHEAGEEL